MQPLHNSYNFESRSFLFLADEKHNAKKNVINPDGLTTLRMPVIPPIRILFVICTNAPSLLHIIEAQTAIRILFSRGGKFRGRKISRNSIGSGYYSLIWRTFPPREKLVLYSNQFLNVAVQQATIGVCVWVENICSIHLVQHQGSQSTRTVFPSALSFSSPLSLLLSFSLYLSRSLSLSISLYISRSRSLSLYISLSLSLVNNQCDMLFV